MPRTINAIFENGVFKPLQKVHVKEHEQVEIKILARNEWQKRFDRIIKKIHKKSAQFASSEIESDIAAAMKEVKAKKRAS